MPIGLCPHCQRRFVIEDERSSQRTCPRCLHPMQLPPRGEPAADPPPVPHPTLSAAPNGSEALYLNGEPLAVSETGQRLLTALAEAGYQSDLAQQLRREARRQRREAAPAEAGAAPPSVLFPRREAPPPSGPREGFLVRQAQQLQQRSVGLTGKAQAVCIEARIIQGQSRVARKDRQSHRERFLLPPLDYVLASLTASPPWGLEDEEAGVDRSEVLPFSPLPTAGTTLYVWGYEPPQSLLCREQCEATESAARFAAQGGWEASRPGAWAKAITLPMTLSEALRTLAPLLRADPGVAGWGLRGE